MRRQITITFLAIVLWIAATVGAALLFPGTFLDSMWQYNRPAHAAFQALGRPTGSAFLALALLAASTAAGLLRGRHWAWWLAVGIFATNGLGDAITLIQTHDLIRSGSAVLIAAVFLGLLISRSIRNYPK